MTVHRSARRAACLAARASLASFNPAMIVAIALALVIGTITSAGASESQLWHPTTLSDSGDLPDARDVVRQMVEFVKAHQVAFEAHVSYEAPQESGQKLQFDMLHQMRIIPPSQLFWVTLHDNAAVDSAWFDTGVFTMLKQPANAWGRVHVPPTIPDAVDRLVHEYGLDVPFPDILGGDPLELWLGDDVSSVEYVAEAWVDGVWTDHIAIRRPGRDIEMWVSKGDEPFPRRLRVVFTDAPSRPSYFARFRDWSTTIPQDSVPTFRAPPGSENVELVPRSK